MAKYTLLQIVQYTLSCIDAMNVQSITDTEEAEQVVLLTQHVYDELLDDFPWAHLRSLTSLEVTDVDHQMRLPEAVSSIDWIRYNKKDITYLTPYEMQKMLDTRDTTASNVDSYGAYTDKDPSYWTTTNDEDIIFDSYDGSLVSALSTISVVSQPVQLSENTDTPTLPEILFGVLINRVIAAAFLTLKGDIQTAGYYDNKATRQLYKAKRWAQRHSMKKSTFNNGYGWNVRRVGGSREIPTSWINEA